MVVLSLFDGMGCGYIALKELGAHVEKYFASEIDKFAIKQTQHNFPDVIHLGDIENWREWDIDWKIIDLVLAGSPCQGFSFAGKHLNFDDPRSKLFFVFLDILNHIKKFNPEIEFLLENVKMKKELKSLISNILGISPVEINSALVSAQNRQRLYWTNINSKPIGLFGELQTDIPQPKDRGILLKDILLPESEIEDKYYISSEAINRIIKNTFVDILLDQDTEKSKCMISGYTKMRSECNYIKVPHKSYCIDANYSKGPGVIDLTNCKRQIIIKLDKKANPKRNQDKADCFTAGGNSAGNHSDMDLIYLSPCYRTDLNFSVRRLTPYECCKLQTIPDWYIWVVSNSQIYKMLGNGWTIEVIKYILSFMKY